MLGRNGNTAYVRYNSQGRIVAGGPIISPIKPKNGNWIAVSNVLGTNTTGTNGNILRAFIRLDMFGRVVPSSLVIQTKEPLDANSGTGWIELNAIYRGSGTTTTTTSSSSTTTTTSSSTSTTTSTTSSTSSTTTSTTTTLNPFARYSYFEPVGTQPWILKLVYSNLYEKLSCNQYILWFSDSSIGIGTRVYYDSAYTSPLVQPYNALITISTTSVDCLNVPGTLPVYTVDNNGYIIDVSHIVDEYAYRTYVEPTGGSWYNTLNPFTTDCTQYFNSAYTLPTVNSINIGTTVYSSLGPAAHDPNFGLLAYSGNVYSVAVDGVVTSLLTNCGGTTTTTTTTLVPTYFAGYSYKVAEVGCAPEGPTDYLYLDSADNATFTSNGGCFVEGFIIREFNGTPIAGTFYFYWDGFSCPNTIFKSTNGYLTYHTC